MNGNGNVAYWMKISIIKIGLILENVAKLFIQDKKLISLNINTICISRNQTTLKDGLLYKYSL